MRFIFIILFILSSLLLVAQNKIQFDSSAVQQRSFSASSLDKYLHDADFQYDKEMIETPSLWDRFWQWFWRKYDELMSTEAGRTTMRILYWLLGIGTVAFFIFRVMHMSRMNLFAGESEKIMRYSVEDENIHAISFDAAIQQAIENGNYRLAIRFLYLQSLKLLSDKNIINWQPDKTNSAYLHEISKPAILHPFRNMTEVFEYTWYGNLAVSRENFSEMREEFTRFQSQL